MGPFLICSDLFWSWALTRCDTVSPSAVCQWPLLGVWIASSVFPVWDQQESLESGKGPGNLCMLAHCWTRMANRTPGNREGGVQGFHLACLAIGGLWWSCCQVQVQGTFSHFEPHAFWLVVTTSELNKVAWWLCPAAVGMFQQCPRCLHVHRNRSSEVCESLELHP